MREKNMEQTFVQKLLLVVVDKLAIGLLILIAAFFLNRLMEQFKREQALQGEDRTRKLQGLMRYYERQMEELYGPLFNMILQIYIAFDISTELKSKLGSENETIINEFFQKNYFIPLHEEINNIMKKNLYLLLLQYGSSSVGNDIKASVPESFRQYLRHSTQEQAQGKLWKDHQIDSLFIEIPKWPWDFDGDIAAGLKAAMKNYEECLAGLKA
jgi:hypothetical protein